MENGTDKRRTTAEVDTDTQRARDKSGSVLAKVRSAAMAYGHEPRPGTSAIRTATQPVATSVSDEERDWAFGVIRSARAVIGKETSRESTQEDYRRKMARLQAWFDEESADSDAERWLRTLGWYHPNPSSFRAYKAALCWGMKQQIRQAIAEQDRLQRAGDQPLLWILSVGQLKTLVDTLKEIEETTRDSNFWTDHHELPGRQGTRKQRDLARQLGKDPHCLEKVVVGMAGTAYADAAQVCRLVGCRPAELEKGVHIRRSGPREFTITVQGAKVGENSGQPSRTLTFNDALMPSAWRPMLDAGRQLVVKIDSSDAFRESMKRVSERLFPKWKEHITPYSFRHYFAGELRGMGVDTVTLAGALGHLVPETQKAYGDRSRRGKGPRSSANSKKPISVTTARAVREPDHSGLNTVRTKTVVKTTSQRGPRPL